MSKRAITKEPKIIINNEPPIEATASKELFERLQESKRQIREGKVHSLEDVIKELNAKYGIRI